MASCATKWKNWQIFNDTSSESSEDDLMSRRIYAQVRNRLKSSDSDTSGDDDTRFNEIQYGKISDRKSNKSSKRKPFADVQNRSIANFKPTNGSSVYCDIYNTRSALHEIENEKLDLKGVVKLVITGSSRRIVVTILELRVFGQDYKDGNACVKAELHPSNRSNDVFQTKTESYKKDSSIVFHESFSFERPQQYTANSRILISAWSICHGSRAQKFVGCTSFNLQRIRDKQEIIQGTYYLLNDVIGKRKHLLASSHNVKRCANKIAVGLYNRDTRNHPNESITEDSDGCIKYVEIQTKLSGKKQFLLAPNTSRISFIDQHSISFRNGLRRGDNIVKLNDKSVGDIGFESLWDIINNTAEKIIFTVKRTSRDTKTKSKSNKNITFDKSIALSGKNKDQLTSTAKKGQTYGYQNQVQFYKPLKSCKTVETKLIMGDRNDLVVAKPVASFAPKCAKIINNKQIYKINRENRSADAECKPRLTKHSTIVGNEATNIPPSLSTCENLQQASDEMSLSSDSGISETTDVSGQDINKVETNTKSLDNNIEATNVKVKPFFLTSWLRHKDSHKSFLSNMQEELRTMSIPDRLKLLRKVLQSKKEIRLFRTYMESVYSEENIDFWLECQEYKKCAHSKQTKMASKIFSTYISPTSAKEVNITFEVRSKIEKDLDKADENLFNEAQQSIYNLMETGTFLQYLQYILSN